MEGWTGVATDAIAAAAAAAAALVLGLLARSCDICRLNIPCMEFAVLTVATCAASHCCANPAEVLMAGAAAMPPGADS